MLRCYVLFSLSGRRCDVKGEKLEANGSKVKATNDWQWQGLGGKSWRNIMGA